jgi:iron complex transport system permease protein
MNVSRFRLISVFSLLLLSLATAAAASLFLGSSRISFSDVVAVLTANGGKWESLVLLQMRLPRLILGVLVGGGIAVSGVLLQAISRNDLASPDTVGINAGAGLGMMLLLVVFPTAVNAASLIVPIGSMLGGLAIAALIFILAYRHGAVLPTRLLLAGVAVGFGAHAAMLLFSLRMSWPMYNYVLTWTTGKLSTSNWNAVLMLLPFCLLLIPLAAIQSRILNLFSLGDGIAANLGVAVERRRLWLLAIAALLTSSCTAVGGHIGFLGLAAPHLARRLIGINHVYLFPASLLCGATLLLAADALSKYLFSPIQIPAGVFVGILGGAYFLYLLAVAKN